MIMIKIILLQNIIIITKKNKSKIQVTKIKILIVTGKKGNNQNFMTNIDKNKNINDLP
jgi:hypothetical protein